MRSSMKMINPGRVEFEVSIIAKGDEWSEILKQLATLPENYELGRLIEPIRAVLYEGRKNAWVDLRKDEDDQ